MKRARPDLFRQPRLDPGKEGRGFESAGHEVHLVDRGRVPAITDLGERQARTVLPKLIERGVLASASHRAPVRLAFPSALAERWFPNLYPDLH